MKWQLQLQNSIKQQIDIVIVFSMKWFIIMPLAFVIVSHAHNQNTIKICKKHDSQQAVSSSLPSSQSRFWSHNCVLAMHFGAPFGPPRGHKNLLSGQAIDVQFASSDWSLPKVQEKRKKFTKSLTSYR